MNAGGLGVSIDSDHRELAMEFAGYVSRKEQQLDGYYGHGYLPCRYSAWEAITEDDAENEEIRDRLLQPFRGANSDDFVGEPGIVRTYHDRMEIRLYVPWASDRELARVTSEGKAAVPAPGEQAAEVEPGAAGRAAAADEAIPEEEGAPAKPPAGRADEAPDIAERHVEKMEELRAAVAGMTDQEVEVVLQGTPQEMLPIRSTVPASPAGLYRRLLNSGVYMPVNATWLRIEDDVLARIIQFVTTSQEADRMTPEEAAEWAQAEAEAIVAGKK